METTTTTLAPDTVLFDLIRQEKERQTHGIELIASENFVSSAVLEAAGSNLKAVVKTTVFLADMNDFAQMNNIYAEFFTENFPSRATVQAARLPKDARVEIECVAIAEK